uniref:EGF-like domain-containing protein n=1 Tax=Macrostomum lignano TaxID=282301 RepID=A0A1I8FLC3_9PLAT
MRVQFHTYYNHDSRASDGTYCDTFFSWRESACDDPKFQLFADRTNAGGIQITVVAMDKDEFYDDHMDHFYASLPARADSATIPCDSNGNKVCMSARAYNGGTCSNVGDIANCTCTPNFNGSRCETDVNECELDLPTCSNGGTCLNTYGGFDCVCPENSTGSRCEDLNECALDIPPCPEQWHLHQHFWRIQLQLPPNFNGSLCETDVNECDNRELQLCAATEYLY